MPNKQPFQRPTRIENIYRVELDRLFDKYFNLPTATTLGEINARLVEFAHARNFFSAFGQTMAKRMITMVVKENTTSWRLAASKASNGRIIHQMLRRDLDARTIVGARVNYLIEQNSHLISTVPENIQFKLAKWIQEQQVKGLRSEHILRQLQPKFHNLRTYEIRRIARTEVAKADTAITRARAESIGLNWYQWQTSEDARVRLSHRKMDLVLINWNDAPSPEMLVGEKSEGHYHAGNIWNCRCIALPLTTLNEVSWPCKVYTNNTIRRLSRKQFVLISGMPKELAA